MAGIKPYGLSGTRYGVRLGSMAASDVGNTVTGFPLGQVANWGQGFSPFFDVSELSNTAGDLPQWTPMPYLRPSSSWLFDYDGATTGGSMPTWTNAQKMSSPQDILLNRTQAADSSRQHAHSAIFGLGEMGASGTTISPNTYGMNLTSMMVDVSPECILAGLDRNAYKDTIQGHSPAIIAGPAVSASYSPFKFYTPGPWITAGEMFANSAIYCYVGARDDQDNVLGVTAYVNCALSRISYQFAVGSGLRRSVSLMSPWSVEFSGDAIAAWYKYNPRYRLTTPGIQVNSTAFGTSKDFGYAQNNGGEFMARYDVAADKSLGVTNFAVAPNATQRGHKMSYLTGGDGVNTLNGWGFLPAPAQTVLGNDNVFLPSMTVGRDCFLELAYFDQINQQWQWASFTFNANLEGTFGNFEAGTPTGINPGGIARVQSFDISGQSRAQMVEELGNRSSPGIVADVPTVSGTISILETDVAGFEAVLYKAVNPVLWPSAVNGASVSGTRVTTDGSIGTGASPGLLLKMFDLEQPMRVNAILTVLTPGSARTAMVRFVVPNIRVSSSSRRVMVNGVAARQYAFVCEDGGVASGYSLIGTRSTATPLTGYAPQGNVTLNTSASPDGYGLILGNNGGQTGGFAVQSFYIPAL